MLEFGLNTSCSISAYPDKTFLLSVSCVILLLYVYDLGYCMIVGILAHALLRKRSLKSRIAYKSCTWLWRDTKGIYLSEDSSEANEYSYLLAKDGMINRSPTSVSE